jgi:hypothetical protein
LGWQAATARRNRKRPDQGGIMDDQTREKYLKVALVVFGVVFFLVYPLSAIGPRFT